MFDSVWRNISYWWLCIMVLTSYVIAYYIWAAIDALRKNRLPGPWGVPLLGYLPFMTRQPHVKLYNLSKKYGDVFAIDLIGDYCVVLNSYDSIKEAYVTMGMEFAAVPQKFNFVRWFIDNRGLPVLEGEEWKIQRHFVIQTLRELGMGKNTLADRISHITQDVLKEFRSHNGVPFDPDSVIYICTTNVICGMLFNKHYHHEDPEFKGLVKYSHQLSEVLSGVELLLAKGKLFYLSKIYRDFRPIAKFLYDLMEKFIAHHKKVLDEGNAQDYVDFCLIKMQEMARKDVKQASYCTERHIAANCLTLFLGGTETTTASIYSILNYMLAYPEVQKKIQKELDEVVGQERLPTWSDRTSLPYTQAVMQEIQRMASAARLGLPHSNCEETDFRGFSVPKRSTIFANLWAANRDPKYWSKPDEFDPTRFLDHKGNYTAGEAVIPFSIGKRACPGENLAQMQMFLFLTAILHRFTLTPPEGVKPSLQNIASHLCKPRPYQLRALPR